MVVVIWCYYSRSVVVVSVLLTTWGGGVVFFYNQKTAYEMRISDWSSDVCSSDLGGAADYQEKLRACHVIVDHEERAALIREGAHKVAADAGLTLVEEIGRASCRERVCQYASISGVPVV